MDHGHCRGLDLPLQSVLFVEFVPRTNLVCLPMVLGGLGYGLYSRQWLSVRDQALACKAMFISV